MPRLTNPENQHASSTNSGTTKSSSRLVMTIRIIAGFIVGMSILAALALIVQAQPERSYESANTGLIWWAILAGMGGIASGVLWLAMAAVVENTARTADDMKRIADVMEAE